MLVNGSQCQRRMTVPPSARGVPEEPDLGRAAAVLPEQRAGHAVLEPPHDELAEDGVLRITPTVPTNLSAGNSPGR
jgi:hypothetical protein